MIEIDATNLNRAMNCPGWLFMPASLPADNDFTARDEGNAAHWVALQMFNGYVFESDSKAPNGFVVSTDMLDHVSSYLSSLDCGEMEVITTFADPTGLRWRVNARADHIVYSRGIPDVLTIDDFKYGWRIVEPEMNWTLIAHAIGYCLGHGDITPSTITLRIHQPRPYHPTGKMREWSFTYDQLLQFHAQIDATLSNPSQELHTGPHCAKCHALPTCPAARAASMNAIDSSGIAFTDELPPEILTFELDTLRRASEIIKTRLDALEELTTHKIKNGQPIPNYAVQQRYGDSRFKTGIDANILKIMIGIDCSKQGTITPAEAKRRAKGNDAAIIALDKMIDRPMIGTKLVRIDADQSARQLLKK
jgi:hypothetical protein